MYMIRVGRLAGLYLAFRQTEGSSAHRVPDASASVARWASPMAAPPLRRRASVCNAPLLSRAQETLAHDVDASVVRITQFFIAQC